MCGPRYVDSRRNAAPGRLMPQHGGTVHEHAGRGGSARARPRASPCFVFHYPFHDARPGPPAGLGSGRHVRRAAWAAPGIVALPTLVRATGVDRAGRFKLFGGAQTLAGVQSPEHTPTQPGAHPAVDGTKPPRYTLTATPGRQTTSGRRGDWSQSAFEMLTSWISCSCETSI